MYTNPIFSITNLTYEIFLKQGDLTAKIGFFLPDVPSLRETKQFSSRHWEVRSNPAPVIARNEAILLSSLRGTKQSCSRLCEERSNPFYFILELFFLDCFLAPSSLLAMTKTLCDHRSFSEGDVSPVPARRGGLHLQKKAPVNGSLNIISFKILIASSS
jgi:hypothetical protein